jgi:hypothetical protein
MFHRIVPRRVCPVELCRSRREDSGRHVALLSSSSFQVALTTASRRFVFLSCLRRFRKSFLPYAWPQAPGAEALLRARDQLGGMRWGRVHWPSRIFLRAMWRACRVSNRLRAPVSMDQTTWRISSGAVAVEAADWRSRLKRPSSNEVSFRSRGVLVGVERPPLLPVAPAAASVLGAVGVGWDIKVRIWQSLAWSSADSLEFASNAIWGWCRRRASW